MPTNNDLYVTQDVLDYYDLRIKEYIDEKVKPLSDCASQTALEEVERRVDGVETQSAVNAEGIVANKDHIDENEAAILVLQEDDKKIREDIKELSVALENTIDKSVLDSYATKEYVDGLSINVDLSNYYTKDETDIQIQQGIEGLDAVSSAQLQEMNFATISYVDNKLAEEYVTKQDLTGLASESYVDNKFSELKIPTKTSELTNDSMFLTAIPEEYVTETELNDALDKIEHPVVDLTGYATEEWVNSKEFATKAELPDVSKFITEIPEEYITEKELDDKGYLTEHQSLENYALKSEIPDVSNFATKDEIPSIDELVSKTELIEGLNTKANDILFPDNLVVKNPVGGFVYNMSVQNMTLQQLFTTLLNLVPYQEEPEESDSIVNRIITEEAPMYSINSDFTVVEIPFKLFTYNVETAQEPVVESGFYQTLDETGAVIESGYQDVQAYQNDAFYIIALPSYVDYNTMISVKVFDELNSSWKDYPKFDMTNDLAYIQTICNEEPKMYINNVPENYTLWMCEEAPTGKLVRFLINETEENS